MGCNTFDEIMRDLHFAKDTNLSMDRYCKALPLRRLEWSLETGRHLGSDETMIPHIILSGHRQELLVYASVKLPKWTGVKSGNIPLPRLYAGRLWAPQNLPRGRSWTIPPGRLRRLPESTPPSQDLPPLYCDLVRCLRLPESTPPSQNIPPFSTTICDPPRIYPSLPEYTTIFNNYLWSSQNLPLPPRIYPHF